MIAAVLADDFTGANDCAGSFAQHGFRAYSSFGGLRGALKPEVFVQSLETRFADGPAARQASRSAWNALAGQGRLISYQRMDSTLRGNAGPEILGMLEALQAPRIAFCAAYPQHGREIRKGTVYVRGVRLDRSEYAKDPLSPSKGARPARLLPPGLAAEIGTGTAASLRISIRASRARVLCFDARSDRDLAAIAAACLAEGIRHFAGASGLSAALAGRLRPAGRPVKALVPPKRCVLAGSVSQTTLDQLNIAASEGADWIDLERGGKAARGSFMLSSLRSRAQLRRLPGIKARRRFADARMRLLVRRGLRLAGGAKGRLWLLSGGHCAETFFRELKLDGAWVRGMLLPGLPLLDAGQGILAVTKPGGFGTPELIAQFMDLG